jgi:cephalosporin hydroxylase
VDGKWKRRYFATEAEAIAFAEEQNASAEKASGPSFQINGAPAAGIPAVAAEGHPLQSLRALDFADLTAPVYLGPRIERYLGDSWCMHLPFAYDLMRELSPKVFVELGVKQGESYFAFCQSAVENKINVRCYGVDSWRGDVQTGNLDPEIEHEVARYNWRYSSFSDLKVMLFAEALAEFADGSIDLLHIDGTHTYSDVKTDFESWLPKLSRGGVILFHDVVVRDGGFGVWKVWDEIVGEQNSFLFEFGHGLGVWKKQPVTPSDPAFLRRLMSAHEAEKRDINRFYANAASALALWHDLRNQPESANEVSSLLQKAEENETQIAQFQRDIEDYRAQIANFQREVEEKTKQVAELQASVEAKLTEIRDLRERNGKLENEADQLREITKQISDLQLENAKQLQTLETVRGQIEQKEDRLARASKDLLDAQWEVLTLRRAALRGADAPDSAPARVLELENRAEVAESDRDHLRQMVIGLQRDVEQTQLLQEELKAAQDQLNAATKGLRTYEKRMDQLRQNFPGKLILPFGRSQLKLQKLVAATRTDD